MKFIIDSTSDWDGLTNILKGKVKQEYVTLFTDCTIKTVKDAIAKQKWVRDNLPKQMDGFVRVYFKNKFEVSVIEIKTLKDLVELTKITDHPIIISDSRCDDIPFKLEIYNDYRE